MTSATAGLVLAAGEGRRFGGPKAPYVVDGERLVDRAVRLLRAASCDPVVVVLGAWVGEVPGAEVVVNDDWASGMGSSLRRGLEHLGTLEDVDRVLVTLVDLPDLTVAAVDRLVAAATGAGRMTGTGTGTGAGTTGSPRTATVATDARAVLASATYDGVRGHPVLIGRVHWAGVAAGATGDRGARAYLASHDVTLVEVGDVASGTDLDERPPLRP